MRRATERVSRSGFKSQMPLTRHPLPPLSLVALGCPFLFFPKPSPWGRGVVVHGLAESMESVSRRRAGVSVVSCARLHQSLQSAQLSSELA